MLQGDCLFTGGTEAGYHFYARMDPRQYKIFQTPYHWMQALVSFSMHKYLFHPSLLLLTVVPQYQFLGCSYAHRPVWDIIFIISTILLFLEDQVRLHLTDMCKMNTPGTINGMIVWVYRINRWCSNHLILIN